MTNTQHAQLLEWLQRIDRHCERIADACERAEARIAEPAAPPSAPPPRIPAPLERGKRGGGRK